MMIVRKQHVQSGGVTTTTLFTELSAMRLDIASLLTKVEVMNAGVVAINGAVADHESRLRAAEANLPAGLPGRLVAVEKWQWRASAVIGAVAVAAGILSGYLGTLLAHVH